MLCWLLRTLPLRRAQEGTAPEAVLAAVLRLQPDLDAAEQRAVLGALAGQGRFRGQLLAKCPPVTGPRRNVLAAAAWAEGRMSREVVPFPVPPKYTEAADRDNGIRDNQTIEALAKLKPAFAADGLVDRDLGGRFAADAEG